MNTKRLIQPVQAAVRRSGGWFVVGSVVCALTSAGGGALSVLADARWLRLAAATVAMLAAAGWALTWWKVGRPTGPVQQRVLWLLGVVALSLCASIGALVGSATWLGRMLADRPGPLDVGQVEVRGMTLTWYDAGVLGLALLAVALLTWWLGSLTRALAGFAFLARRARRVGIAGAAVGLALTALSSRDVPNELSPDESRRVRALGAGRYDRMLVIDPADHASRMLIRLARELVQTGDQRVLLRPAFRTAEYNLAYGLAVTQPPRGERPLWRLVEPPTDDPFELAASLARIKPRDGPPATGSYGRLLVDTLVPERVRWRTGAQRGVAFVLDELPSLGELDRGMRGAGAIGRWADPSDACEKFVHGREIRAERVSKVQTVAVAWGDALAAQCHVGPTSRVALDVLTGEKRLGRVASWRSWARALGGRFDSWGDITPPGRLLISAARALHTGQPVGQLGPIVDLFRPHLAFDKQEEFFPVDIDWLLTPEVRLPRTPPTCTEQVQIEYGQEQCMPRVSDAEINRVCDREAGKDNCEDIANAASLVGQLDEFLDFAGGGRLGRDRVGKNQGPSRMYVHVLEHAGHLYLGYWWFLPFNASPWRPEVNCLPGLAIKEATCFDHEGDWEGVTVVLELIDERALPDAYVLSNLKPDSVLYEAHGTPIRWPWELVELAADRGSGLYATHPVVYVAKGSHASYPAPCDDEECDQRLARLGSRGEGGFDGAQRWTYNHRCADYQLGRTSEDQGPCLAPLPATGDGLRGVLWNAFPGRWGKATCSVIAKFCSAVDGPRSPSHQPRFKTPSSAGEDGLPPTLRRQRQRHGGTAGSEDPPAWPPPGRRIPDTPVLPSGR